MGPAHILFLAVSLPYIAALHTQLHKHMTPDELRSVFHVEHHSLVPEYQVVQLKHHVSKRSIPSASSDNHQTSNQFTQNYGSQKFAHDKLSKQDYLIKNAHKFKDYNVPISRQPTEYFSERESDDLDNLWPVNDSDAISVGSDNVQSVKPTRTEGVKVVSDVNESGVKSDVKQNSLKDVEHVDEDLDHDTHKIKFEAFGKPVELVLKKTEGLFKKDGLKMWTLVGNDTEPHGVEVIETDHMGDEKDHIGETYQDEDTLAALVIRRDPKEGLLVEGSIGHDLVIKPLPSTLSPTTTPKPPLRKTIPPEEDDEMFMDPNQDDMVSIDTGLPIKRSKIAKKNLSSQEKNSKSTITEKYSETRTFEPIKNTDAMSTEVMNATVSINKMNDNEDDIIYDDEEAKAESRRLYQTAYKDINDETVEDMRRAIIEALSGAKHVVYKRDTAQATEDELSDYAFMEPDRLHKRYRKKRSAEYVDEPITNKRVKRDAPYVIYPEILVIVDYDGYRLHGGDNLQIKRYFVSFWNGVDLRYKLLKGPKIRISIAGIIISRGRDATPYLERNRVGRDAIDSAAALTDMGKYLFRERRLPVYDIAVAVTKLDMCRRQYANDVCNRGTAGFAYVGGACVVNKRLEKVNSVAIIEDTGGFSGIIVAAHEVGHLLGAVHDGSPPPSYLGGPGAEKCRWEDGYIMSDLRHTEKGFRWSPCSVVSFHHFLNGDTATCLFNSPHEDESLPRVLPGKLLSLDAQCRKDRGTNACFKDERVCAQLFCFDAGSGYCVAYRPAAEGSPCGDGQYCINGRCVAEHENIIPDYSQHTPSYIRRENSPFYNETVQRYLIEQTTQAYGTYPVVPIGLTYSQPYSPFIQSSPYVTQYTFPTQKPVQYQYNSIPAPRSSFSYSPLYSTTRNPYDFRNFPVYHYTAETKQTQYTLPSSSSSQEVSTESTTSTSTTPSPTTTTRTTSTTTTTQRPFFLRFKFSTTKNPYDFKDFTTQPPLTKSTNKVNLTSTTVGTTTTAKPQTLISSQNDTSPTTPSTLSTSKPKYGFASKLDLRNYFNRTTTKNPYDFDLTNYKDISNNNIKRSYSIQSYFGSQSNPVAKVANLDNSSPTKVTTIVPLLQIRPVPNK